MFAILFLLRFSADAISSAENKKASKSTKSKANKVLSNDRLHDGLPTDEEHSPMEVDCKEVIHNEHNHEITKESLSVNNEHYSDSRTILQEFVKEKLHRTVLSFADFKKLLLLRQTGKLHSLKIHIKFKCNFKPVRLALVTWHKVPCITSSNTVAGNLQNTIKTAFYRGLKRKPCYFAQVLQQ